MQKLFGSLTSNSKQLALFLHGLPGIRSKQNQDLAQNLYEELGVPSLVLFYEGLGVSEGVFSFVQTYKQVTRTVNSVLEQSPDLKIHLIGHSFGGYLSLRLLKDYTHHLKSIFMLSPLLFLLTPDQLQSLFTHIYESYPQLKPASLEHLQKEYQVFTQGYNPEYLKTLVDSLPVKLVQAQNDEITPADYARRFITSTNIQYLEVNQEHSFITDRTEVKNILLDFIKHIK